MLITMTKLTKFTVMNAFCREKRLCVFLSLSFLLKGLNFSLEVKCVNKVHALFDVKNESENIEETVE